MKKSLYILAAVSALLTGCSQPSDTAPTIDEPLLTSEQWTDYQSYFKISEGREITGDATGDLKNVHKGRKGYRDVFVNDVGKTTMVGNGPYPYPVGTIIVKEQSRNKVAWQNHQLSGTTIMVKMPAGTFPETSDWGYASKTGKLSANTYCAACHEKTEATDFVFTNEAFFALEP